MSGTTASVTRARGGAAAVLPEDLIVWEILVRLPARPLLRCRAVCRSWRRRTSERAFLLAHHRRQPSLPLVAFHDEAYRRTCNAIAVDTVDLRRRSPSERRQPVVRFTDYHHYDLFLHASCDGLLLFALSDKDFYLCNPATRQCTALPRLVRADGAALYPHAASGEYRVVYWKGRFSPERKLVYHVTSLGSSAEPRRVEASTARAKQLVENGRHCLSLNSRPGVLLHGCLHWLLHGSSEKELVVFDTAAESFGSLPSPVAADRDEPQLLEVNGALAVSWMDPIQTMMKLWVLQDRETGVWSLKHQVTLPVMEIRAVVRKESCRFYGTVVSEDGGVLLHCHHYHCFHLLHIDRKGVLVHKFRWNREFSCPAGHWFRESLVRHDFFERQDGGTQASATTQPSFFQGLGLQSRAQGCVLRES